MMIERSSLKTLIEILNSNSIVWGVGGSYLLQLYDLYSEPNDLDLWVQPSDMPRIRKIFCDYHEIITHICLPKELHFKMLYQSTEVDFVACFITKPNQHRFEFQIKPSNIRTIQLGENLTIPCTFLEDWYIIYRLLGRNDKAELIWSFFSKKKIEIDRMALEQAITSQKNNLPKYLRRDIPKLVEAATQYSMFDNDIL